MLQRFPEALQVEVSDYRVSHIVVFNYGDTQKALLDYFATQGTNRPIRWAGFNSYRQQMGSQLRHFNHPHKGFWGERSSPTSFGTLALWHSLVIRHFSKCCLSLVCRYKVAVGYEPHKYLCYPASKLAEK